MAVQDSAFRAPLASATAITPPSANNHCLPCPLGISAGSRRADRSGAELALVIGDEEAGRDEVTIKPLRAGGEQETVARQAIVQRLGELLALEQI